MDATATLSTTDRILCLLRTHPSLRIGELETRIGKDRNTIRHALRSLERQGLIRSNADLVSHSGEIRYSLTKKEK